MQSIYFTDINLRNVHALAKGIHSHTALNVERV